MTDALVQGSEAERAVAEETMARVRAALAMDYGAGVARGAGGR